MPGPDTTEADKELDALFTDEDKLPVVKAPLPHVDKVLDLKSNPEADAELDALLAAPTGPHHATKEEANSAEMPTSGKTIEMPVQQIEGALPEDKRSILDKATDAIAQATHPSSRDGIPASYAGDVTPEQKAAVEQQAHDKLGVRSPNDFIERASDAALGAAGPGVVKAGGAAVSAGLPAALAGKTALQRLASNFGQNFVQTAGREFVRDPQHDVGGALKSGLTSGIGAAGLGMASEGLGQAAAGAGKAANELMTHTFMSAPQRAALRARKGPDALSQLGADADKAGLFKARNLWDRMPFVPVSANRVADNAARVQAESGKAIGDFEDSLASKGVNPDVNVAPIADELHNQAGQVGRVRDKAAQKYAQDLRDAARTLSPTERVAVEGTHTTPPNIPEWMKRESPPANLPPQPELPGVDTSPRPGPSAQLGLDFVPPKPPTQSKLGQLEMLLPRAEKPGAFVPGSTQGQQMSLNMPMSGQKSLPLEAASQAPLDFPQTVVPEPGPGAPQQTYLPNMSPGADIPPSAASLNGQLPLPSQQLEMNLPAPSPAEAPFTPGNLQGEQQSFSGMDTPMGGQQRLPHTSAAEQMSMELPHRSGPQYTQKPLEGVASVQSDTMPLQDAIATKRFQGDQINWARNPNTTPMRRGQDVARKFTWGQLKDTIQRSLDNEAAKGTIDPKALENYRAANKNFTTASTAYDPALRMAERNNQRGLSLKDLMAGAVMGGPTGAVTALGSGAAHGKLPSSLARGAKISGGIAKLGQGAAVAEKHMLRDDTSHPTNPVDQAKAELPPETPDHEVKAAANSKVKENLAHWYDRFLQKKE